MVGMDQWHGPMAWTAGIGGWHGLLAWTDDMDGWHGWLAWTVGMDCWHGHEIKIIDKIMISRDNIQAVISRIILD
jgi:hypothetical protein